MSNKTKKQLLLNLPYFIAGLVGTNLGEAWRIAEGADMSEKLLGFLSALGAAFSNPMPSLHPLDLLIGVCCGAARPGFGINPIFYNDTVPRWSLTRKAIS